jgi:hypothetical protein
VTFPHVELELNRHSGTRFNFLTSGLYHLVAQGIGLKSHADPVRFGLDQGAELALNIRAWPFNPAFQPQRVGQEAGKSSRARFCLSLRNGWADPGAPARM